MKKSYFCSSWDNRIRHRSTRVQGRMTLIDVRKNDTWRKARLHYLLGKKEALYHTCKLWVSLRRRWTDERREWHQAPATTLLCCQEEANEYICNDQALQTADIFLITVQAWWTGQMTSLLRFQECSRLAKRMESHGATDDEPWSRQTWSLERCGCRY